MNTATTDNKTTREKMISFREKHDDILLPIDVITTFVLMTIYTAIAYRILANLYEQDITTFSIAFVIFGSILISIVAVFANCYDELTRHTIPFPIIMTLLIFGGLLLAIIALLTAHYASVFITNIADTITMLIL